jgi:autotransporter-associated beta strand protein
VFTNNVEINVGGAANNNAAIMGQGGYSGTMTFLGSVTLKATAAGITRSLSAEVPTTLAGAIAEEQPDTTFKKVGASTLTILNTAGYSGSTVISNGILRVMEAGELTATTNILVADGRSLVLGATDETVSKTSRINDASTLSIGGSGTLGLAAAADVNETVGAISLSGQRLPVVTLDAAAGAQADLTAAELVRVDPGQLLVVRGTNLGATPGAGTTHIFLTTPPALTGGGGSGPQVSIVPWILGAQGTTGSGSDFTTYDATRGLRPLDATEYDSTVAGASPTRNVNLSVAETLAADQTINALRLAGGTLTNAPGGTLAVTSGAILAYDADAGISGGRLAFGAAEGAFHIVDEGADQARTVTVSAALSGTGGFSLNANHANSVLQLNSSSLVTGVAALAGTVAVNGGQVRMGAANVLHGTPLTVNSGAKVVLNGFSQTIGDLSGSGNIEDGASSGTPVLTVHQTANGTYSGVIATSGDRTIALTKIGNGVLTLTANQNLNGDVRIEGGGIILSGGGQLDDPNNVIISGSGALRLYNLAADLDNTRLKTGATIFMSGGTYSSGHDNGSVSPNVMQTTPLTLLAGGNMVSNRQAASGQTSTLGFGSLSRSAGASVDFGGAGLGATTRNRIVFTAAPTLDDGIIAGWATVGNEFATYDTVSTAGSVAALATYTTTDESTWAAANNVKLTLSGTTTLTGPRTVNTLNVVASGTPVLALGGYALVIDAGGLIVSGSASPTISTVAGGSLTVGPGADSLYEMAARIASGRTLTITAPIVDNGANPVSIVKSGAGALQLNTANNTFTGPVYVNEGTLIIQNAAAIDADNAVILNGVLRLRAATTVKSLSGGETGVVRPYDGTSRTLNINGASGAATFGGTISNNTTGVLTLNKNGAGVQVLSGSNAYTGVTTVNGGLLQFGRRVSLYGADQADWATAKIDVNAGAAMGFNVGGIGEFTASDLDLLLALGTASAGFNNGSFAGLDTSSGDFEYGSIISNPNGGANALGLVKLGGNTLVFPGANTYGGGTLIVGGTLQVGNGGTSGALGGGAVSNDADLAFNRSDAFTFANAIAGSGTLTMRGTGELTLPSANAYTGGTRLFNGTVVVGANGALGTGWLTMGAGATAGALALSNASQAVGSLRLASNGEVTNRIHIGAGQSLNVAGGLTNDIVASGSISRLRLDGAGTLTVTNSGGLFQVGTHETSTSVIDMGALGGVSVDLQTGVFRVGPRTGSNGTSTNVVVLATNSTIVASLIGIGDVVQSTIGGSSLRLGAGVNALYADNLFIAGGKNDAEMLFDGASGSLTLSNLAGTGRANLAVGVNRLGTAVNQTGILDLRGHDVSLYLGSVTNGGRPSGNTGNSAGYLYFDTGVLDATSLIVGLRAGTADGVMTGEVHIGGGTVNLGSVELARNSRAGGTATYGLLNLYGGTITMGGNIIRGGGTGPTTAALLMTNSATLDMGGFSIGSGASPLNVLQLESGTLRNVAEINGGAAWTKTGAGRLTLDGANTFSGGVIVQTGVLAAASATALGTTAGGVTVLPGGTLGLLGGITVAGENVILTGVGGIDGATPNAGALRNISGNNTWAGGITLTGSVDTALFSEEGHLLISGDIADNRTGGNLLLRGNGSGEISGVISGSRSVFKSASGSTNAGTWTLSGTNTYTASTTIAAGTLRISTEANLGTTPASYVAAHLSLRGGLLQNTASMTLSPNRGVTLATVGGGFDTDAGTTQSVQSIIAGATGIPLIKTGAGTLQLSGANTYAGPTLVSNGILRVNGVHSGGGVISLYSGATLAGSGTVAGVTVAAGGLVSPGNSAGTLTVGDLTLDGGALLEYELGTSSDLILAGATILGGVDFDNFTFLPGVGFGPGVYTLIDATSISGLGAGTTGTVGAYDAALSIDNDAQNLVLTVVPEPTTLGLLGLVATMAVLRRRIR